MPRKQPDLVPPAPEFNIGDFVIAYKDREASGCVCVVTGIKFTSTNRAYYYLRLLCSRDSVTVQQKSIKYASGWKKTTCKDCIWTRMEHQIEGQHEA